jgi:hypothetical protein
MVNKIWFYCWECQKYNWVEANKDTLRWYDGLGDDCSYCPHCDDETPSSMEINQRPVGSLLKLGAFA